MVTQHDAYNKVKELLKMDAIMLEGWTPLLLLGLVFVVGVYIISRKVSRNFLLKISSVLSIICLSVILYSIFVVGGWDGMGLGVISIIILLGTWIGTIIGICHENTNG